jgi:hypothetical protein
MSRRLALLLLFACVCAPRTASAGSDFVVYADSLSPPFSNYSFSATVSLANTSPTHSGADSIAVTYTGNYGALYLNDTGTPDISQYGGIDFWFYVPSNFPLPLQVLLENNGTTVGNAFPLSPPWPPNTWIHEHLSLSQFGVSASSGPITGFMLQQASAAPGPTMYVDDVSLFATTPVSAGALWSDAALALLLACAGLAKTCRRGASRL